MKKEDIQEKYVELQMLDKQIKEMHEKMQTLESQGDEIKTIIDSLEELKSAKKGETILVPISSGIFVKAKLEENDQFLMNVGAGVVVNKKTDDAKKLLQEQIDKVKKMKESMTEDLNKMIGKAIPLQEEINSFIEKEKKEEMKSK